MADSTKDTRPKTTIWKNGVDGLTLVKTIPGLPYGTQTAVFIEGLGEAVYSGIQKSGSGTNESVVEVKYTLK